jgi:hypothetical protein
MGFKTLLNSVLEYFIKKLKPHFVTDKGFKQRIAYLKTEINETIRLILAPKISKINQLEKQVELDRKRIDKLENDQAQFGAVIAEIIRLSQITTKSPEKQVSEIDKLTRKFFTQK